MLEARDIDGKPRYTGKAMTYGIFSSAGNLIAWCDSQDAALTALRDLVDEEPEAADELAAIPVTETGRPCGKAILASAAVQQATAA
jgi:hypothetical protein